MNLSYLTTSNMIDPPTGWFEIVKYKYKQTDMSYALAMDILYKN